ncbi:class I SAM-dependent DNA methyltransferase [Dokdonella koreensis]|uniref:Methylase involved in ubiquinone/menaquinone biosynthesis n=1 Tax=Dokdonella koreensis DS-123 TaxID=1300342 RepID=A0A160DV85_9GAMM|nr:class I SAM-dependent methyltransferase [Dokdonella koreensis]ANB18244.1 Methylase involved in ubiquinone/menaquinone biosynthesis [Dokdonella koreensis DS-123]
MTGKHYDRTYFDRWYRDPARRVRSPAATARTVALAVAMAEYYLGRPLRSVLDVGCGEGAWRALLRRLRPGIDYLGLDASEYAVARYGRARNLRLARFGQLGELRFETRFDLIVCSDVLHYVPSAELQRGLSGFAELLEGLAFIEVFTAADDPEGDIEGFIRRSPDWYRRAFAGAGLMACGSHGYLSPRLLRTAAALELAPR